MVAGKVRNASNLLDFALARYDNDNYFNVGITEPVFSGFRAYPTILGNQDQLNLEFSLLQNTNLTLNLVNTSGIPVSTFPQATLKLKSI
ncbi:MAG: hypothetical protein IPH88_16680 [Bacteroidales bacterium]|nr:hypothetical protein [Bacteroidales bacterium]